MMDFNYTPYNVWNANDSISSVSVGSTQGTGGVSAFWGGMHSSSATAISVTGNAEALSCVGFVGSGWTSTGQLIFRSGKGYMLSDFTADSMSFGDDSAVTESSFNNFTIIGGATELFARAVWIRGGSSNLRFIHGEFPISSTTAYTFYIQNAASNNLYFEGNQDYTNLGTFSIYNPGSGTETLVANRFANPIQGTQLPVPLTVTQLKTTQTPTASATVSNYSVPIVLNGTTYYMRLSTTP
jgi:hypothetical protein